MIRTAVILTVFNRREITLQGLRTLFQAIEYLGEGYDFDVYMTDDGCTDGTVESVASEFSSIQIVHGDGNLYWGGGMRKAWQEAIESGKKYNYYLWYNDDALLYKSALNIIFDSNNIAGGNSIISGAFCDKKGNISYGGRNSNDIKLAPNGEIQELKYMNGNLVLIPSIIFYAIGMIDKRFVHSSGDFDYGLRAIKKGFHVYLSNQYVGTTERHDEYIPKYCQKGLTFFKRWKLLHSPIYSPWGQFLFNYKYKGLLSALYTLFASYLGIFSPTAYAFLKDERS